MTTNRETYDKIRACLMEYTCQHIHDEEGDGLPLVDALSSGESIAGGVSEIDLLADDLSVVVERALDEKDRQNEDDHELVSRFSSTIQKQEALLKERDATIEALRKEVEELKIDRRRDNSFYDWLNENFGEKKSCFSCDEGMDDEDCSCFDHRDPLVAKRTIEKLWDQLKGLSGVCTIHGNVPSCLPCALEFGELQKDLAAARAEVENLKNFDALKRYKTLRAVHQSEARRIKQVEKEATKDRQRLVDAKNLLAAEKERAKKMEDALEIIAWGTSKGFPERKIAQDALREARKLLAEREGRKA